MSRYTITIDVDDYTDPDDRGVLFEARVRELADVRGYSSHPGDAAVVAAEAAMNLLYRRTQQQEPK